MGFSLVMENGGYSLVVVCRLLVAMVSLVSQRGLTGTQASAIVTRGLCSAACGTLLDRESDLCVLHWQVDSLRLSRQGSPCVLYSYLSPFFLSHLREFQIVQI